MATEILTGGRSFVVYSSNEFANLCGEFNCPHPEAAYRDFMANDVTKFTGWGPLGNGQFGHLVVTLRKDANFG